MTEPASAYYVTPARPLGGGGGGGGGGTQAALQPEDLSFRRPSSAFVPELIASPHGSEVKDERGGVGEEEGGGGGGDARPAGEERTWCTVTVSGATCTTAATCDVAQRYDERPPAGPADASAAAPPPKPARKTIAVSRWKRLRYWSKDGGEGGGGDGEGGSSGVGEERMLMRAWLEEQLSGNIIDGLYWLNAERTLARVPWMHASRTSWDMKKDSSLFMYWAIHTGEATHDARRTTHDARRTTHDARRTTHDARRTRAGLLYP